MSDVGATPRTTAVDLTRHERALILYALEFQVRDTLILTGEWSYSRHHPNGVQLVMCLECGHTGETRNGIDHGEEGECDVAPLWALYDRLSAEWAADGDPPPVGPR